MNKIKTDIAITKQLATLEPLIGRDRQSQNPDHVYLSFGSPDPNLFPVKAWRNATEEVLRTNVIDALQYAGGKGAERIKSWIIDRGKLRNLTLDEDQILITAGAAQAIDFTTRLLLNPDDEVWVEAPTYFFALQSFHLADANVQMIPMDAAGIDINYIAEQLEDRVKNNKRIPKLLYLMPNFHNPTGKTLLLERRRQLAILARKYDFYIIEDDAYTEINFTEKHVPAIHSFAPERVLYIGTFSKVIAPGVRIGWIAATKFFIDKMKLFMLGPQTSPIVQEILGTMLEDFPIDPHVHELATTYRSKRDKMISDIQTYFGRTVTFHIPDGGFFIWLHLKEVVDPEDLLETAFNHGVSIVIGDSFYKEAPHRTCVRLCYSYCSEEQIERGIASLAKAYHSIIHNKNFHK